MPHGTSSVRSRWRRRLRSRSIAPRRSRSIVLAPSSGRSRSRRCCLARSAASGAIGASSGTVPIARPTINRSRTIAISTSDPSVTTVRMASVSSSRDGIARPRNAARVSARRVASIRCAGEMSRSSARNVRATRAIHVTTSGSRPDQRCSYQPGDGTPAPYPEAAEMRSYVQGTHAALTLTAGGEAFSSLASWAADGRSTSAGTCHAPQTTAIRSWPAASAARIARRMAASRSAVSGSSSGISARTATMASVIASKTSPATRRDSTNRSHQRSPSASPAAVASSPIGSARIAGQAASRAAAASASEMSPSSAASRSRTASAARPRSRRSASSWPYGRSMNRTATPAARAYWSACHSG